MNSPIYDIIADWMDICTIPQFLEDVDPKFQFKGEGWYPADLEKKAKSDTLLIRGTAPTPGSNEATYEFYIWNGRDPRQKIKEDTANLLALPVRSR